MELLTQDEQSFEAGKGGWLNYVTATSARTQDDKYSGEWSYKFTVTGFQGIYLPQRAVTPGATTITFSFWHRTSFVDGSPYNHVVQYFPGGSVSTNIPIPTTLTWTRRHITLTCHPAGTTSVLVYLIDGGGSGVSATNPRTWWVDDISLSDDVAPPLASPPPALVVPWLTPLRDYLRARPAVTAQVGARTYLGALPLGAVLPALVMWRAGGGHDGATMDSGMVQLEAWAASGAQAEALLATAVSELGSAAGMVALSPTARLGGVRLNASMWAPDPDTDTARYVATLDVDVLAS